MSCAASPRRGVSAVLFDLYGTLLDVQLNEDSPPLWAGVAAAVVACGGRREDAAAVRRLFRRLLAEESTRHALGFVMVPAFERLLALLGARPDVALIGRRFRQLSTERLTLRPYVTPLFAALRQASCAIGIVSNTEAVLTHFDLDQHPVLWSTDALVLSSEAGVTKPNPLIFRLALDRLRTTPAFTVMIGDSLADDITGARLAGLRAVHLDPSAPGVEPLADATDDVVRAPPTLDSLFSALHAFGWRAPERT